MKCFCTAMSALLCAPLFATNLFPNPEFDKGIADIFLDYAKDTVKVTIFTEEHTWNKCLRIDNIRYCRKKIDGKEMNISYACVFFGTSPKLPGIPVKPNTVYEFSLELKGNVNVGVHCHEWTGADFWKDGRVIKIKNMEPFTVSGEWTVVKGTFQTSANAKYAALDVQLWGEERYKNLPKLGTYILIDKVRMEEKADLLGSFGSMPVKDAGISVKKTIVPDMTVSGFLDYAKNTPAKADTFMTICQTDDGLKITMKCMEPDMATLKTSVVNDGGNPWNDDCVEFLFAPQTKDRALSQFVVAAGGGRWMGYGTNETIKDFDAWNAKVSRDADSWTVEAVIPYAALGFASRPADGTIIGFNVARNRKGMEKAEITSWCFGGGTFHNTERYGNLLPNGAQKFFIARQLALLTEAKRIGATTLANRIAAWKMPSDPCALVKDISVFEAEIRNVHLDKLKCVIVPLDPTDDPTIPIIPQRLANLPGKITARAAENEFKPIPIGIVNLLGRAEEFRIVVGSFHPRDGSELGGLICGNRYFPKTNMKLYRGVRVKDGDNATHGLRYDALAPMDTTQTVIVMPREATPVWAIFDTRGVAPGIYRGEVRVIPLGETASIDSNTYRYSGPMVCLPFEFEVLPFKLDPKPVLSQFLFQSANRNRAFFNMLVDYGSDSILVSIWKFRIHFNSDGSVKDCDPSNPIEEMKLYLAWAKERGIGDDFKIGIAYNAYFIFRDIFAKKQFKYGTVEWERAWTSFVKMLEHARVKAGVENRNFFVEIWDEPGLKDMKEFELASKLMHKACPDMQIMVTGAACGIPTKTMESLIDCISHWCFWGSNYFTSEEYAPVLAKLRVAKRNISVYRCDTTMRIDLQKYYRSYPWTALAYGADMCNLYQFMTYQHTFKDWKTACEGEIALDASGVPISTIRQECFRIGMTDLRYYRKLDEVLKSSKTTDVNLLREAQDFLKTAPKKLGITHNFDEKLAEQSREKMIDLILLLSK